MQTHYSPLMRVTAASVLITFLMLILEPTVVAAQTLWDDDDQTIITPTVPLLYEAPAVSYTHLTLPTICSV